jgi:phage protein D
MVAVPAITSGGTDIPASFDLVSVEIVREINRIPYAQILLTDGEVVKGEFPALDSDSLAPGAEIEIKIREGDDITPLFKGQVARLRLEYSGGGPRLTAECKDKAMRLTTPRRSIIYPEGSDSDAIAAVLRRAKVDSGDLGSSTGQSTLVQYDSTDWDFIVSRAEASGSAVVVTDGSLSLKPLAVSGTAAWTVQLGIDDIDDFELELDAGCQHPDVSAIGWDLPEVAITDPASAKPIELTQGNIDPADAGEKLGVGEAVLRHLVPMSSDELKSWASARLAQSRLAMIRGRLSLGGAGDIEPMDLVELKGFGERFNGTALITGIRHTIEDGEWRTDLRLGLSSEPFAEPDDIAAPPAQGLLPAARGLGVATIADYEDDPDGEYRLRLTLPGMDGSDDTLWARLAGPEAGKERGYFFRPDPGDEVVIAFLGEDPRHPVVLGALFGSKNKPAKAFAELSSDNVAKGLMTKHGMSLALEDRDGKPVMTLKTPKGVVKIDDDKGEIRLSDGNSNSILLDKDGVVIKSGKDFKLEASGKLAFKGASIDAN